jgi:hypothetical protein
LNLSWWPQQNIDLAVQYTGYWQFKVPAQTTTEQAEMLEPTTRLIFSRALYFDKTGNPRLAITGAGRPARERGRDGGALTRI